MSRDVDYDAEEAVAVRRSRPKEDRMGASALLDRLEKALNRTDEALGMLAERLAPVLGPEQTSGALDGVPSDDARSELSARLDRMCDAADRHRRYLTTITDRIDL